MNFVLKNKQSLRLRQKLFLFIVLIAAFLRFFKLGEYPVHLGHDEVSQLYDAISIAETGRDIYGHPYPFIFQSVNDFKPPFYTYATALMYKIFGWQEITVRITGALFGTLVVIGVYLFVNQFFKNKGTTLIAAALTAISPFEIFYSRKSFENQTGVFLMLIGFTLLLKYVERKKQKFFYLGALVLGLAAYIYFAQAVLIPILLVAFVIIFWKKLKPLNFKPLILFLLVVTPLFYMIFVNPDTRNRSANVFITQDPRLAQNLAGKTGLDRFLTIISFSAVRYINQFNPKYLFFEGLNMTEGKRDVGPLFPVIIPFLLLGIYVLVRQKSEKNEKLFILAWILIGMMPSGLTFEDYSPHRAIATFTMLNVVAAVGIYWFYNSIQEHSAIYCGDELNADMSSSFGGKPRSSERGGCHKQFGKSAFLILLILFGANFVFFAKRYIVNYPIERSEALHYPFREVALYVWENYDKYDQIVFDPKFGEYAPWIGTGAHYYLAFYGHYPPQKLQEEFKVGDQKKRETVFGKISIREFYWGWDFDNRDALIIASPWELTPYKTPLDRINIIKTFYFLSSRVAFHVFTVK